MNVANLFRWTLVWLILLVLGIASSPVGWCADQDEAVPDRDISEVLHYVRVYVPVDRLSLEDCRDKSVHYLPVAPAEFERLVSIAERVIRREKTPTAAAIVSARYTARLEGDTLLGGEAEMDIVHSAEGPVMLPLSPCGLAIGRASWDASEQAAKIGLTADGTMAVLVERSGRLHFNWSLRAAREAAEVVAFRWEAPPCPVNCLVLDLPENVAPSAEHGVVTEEGPGRGGARRWKIEIGGQPQLALRMVPRDVPQGQRPLARARQSTEYSFSPHGLHIKSSLELDVLARPLRQLDLRLDPGLRLTKALYGDRPLRWAFMPPVPEEEGTRVVLELPEPLEGTNRLVEVHALAPLQTGVRWRLPAIRPGGVFWQEGEAVLWIRAPLRLEQLVPIEAEQSWKIEPTRAPYAGERVKLQHFGPDATAEIVLSRPEAPVQLNSALLVEAGGRGMAAQLMADVWVAGHGRDALIAERFQLEADVARHWAIDSIESEPKEALADWSVKDEGARSKLTVQLSKSLPERLADTPPLRLAIAARRLRSPVGSTLGIDDVAPLRFRDVDGGRRLIGLRAREPYEVKLTGGETLTRVDPRSLDAATLALFPEPPRGLVFERDASASDLRVSVEPQEPGYSARIRVEATVSGDSLVESYELGCVPEAGRRVERVLVRFSPRRTAPLRWTPGAQDESHWTMRRLSPTGQTATDEVSDNETWEIQLRPPKSVPFEISATRTTQLTEKGVVSLASVPEAREQRGTVVVCSTGKAVRIENNRLKPIPADAVSAGQENTARAAFRYDPARDVAGGSEATLGIRRLRREDAPPSAWAWSCHLESQYEASGTGRHVATYRLESGGAERVRLTLPRQVGREDVHAVWVNDEQVTPQSAPDQAARVLTIELPSGQRFPVVSICFTTVGEPLSLARALDAPLPEIDVRALTRDWTVWLPPGHEARHPGLRWQSQRRGVSWTQRLFGPLGREPGTPPFDPLSFAAWRRAIQGEIPRRSVEGKASALVRRLGELTARDRLDRGADNLDWGILLTEEPIQALAADASGGRSEVDLLIDRPALSRLGLRPRTPVRTPHGDAPADRGARLLGGASLTLLAHPHAIVVTSTAAAASYHAQLSAVHDGKEVPLEGRGLAWVGPGPLFDQIEQASAGVPGGTFVPVHVWKQRPGDPRLPWGLARPRTYPSAEPRGWTAYQLELSHTGPSRLSLVRRDALRVLRWAAFLAAIGLAWWKAIHRPVKLTALLGLFGVAAFLLPATYSGMASGALLGALFVVGLRLICARPAGDHSGMLAGGSHVLPGKRETTIRAGIFLLATVTLLFTRGSAWGGESGPKSVRAWWPAHGVLIPAAADPDGPPHAMKPTGEKYQVPEDFYDQLKRLAATGAEEPKGWLLAGATYSGSFVWQPAPDRLAPKEIKATFDLEVLGSWARVSIPFGADGPNLVPDGVLLDGRPIPYQWQHGALVLPVSGRQRHRLELLLTPTVELNGTSAGFSLPIPRLANSRLELTAPPDAPTIDVPSALGSVGEERAPDSMRIEAELGPADRLSLQWQQDMSRRGATAAVQVEELLWLKVRAGSVDVDARFKFQVGDAPVQQLFLTVDPWLKPKGPFQCDAGAVAEVPVAGLPSVGDLPSSTERASHLRTIGLELEEPVADRQLILQATFHLKDRTGVGRLSLPHLGTENARVVKRWLAVSVDPSLESEQEGSDDLEPVAVPDFLAAWGDATSQPRFAYSLSLGERVSSRAGHRPGTGSDRRLVAKRGSMGREAWSRSPWSMSTRPRKPETTVEQTAVWRFAAHEARVNLEAQLNTRGGFHFQYRLLVPAELEIDRVSVREGEVERADSWRRAPDGTVTVFLNRALSGQQALSLEGRLPVPARGQMPLPILEIQEAQLQSSEIRLFRAPDVQVDVRETTGLVEVETPVVEESQASSGRLAQSFEVANADDVGATLAVSPNRPDVRAEQITSLRSDGVRWEANVEFRIRVDEGVLDEFRLRLPPQFDGPYEIDRPSTWVVDESDGQRRLLVRPVSPVSDQYRFTVSGPLTLAPGEPASVPQLVLEEVELTGHLLVLPTQSGLRPVAWQTEGLVATDLPEDFAPPLVATEAFMAYRVADGPSGTGTDRRLVAKRWSAILRPFRGESRLAMADVRVAWQADGTCHGVAIFDLEPASRPECKLRLPPEWELLQVTIDGIPIAAAPSGQDLWLIPLGESMFPRRIEVLFRGAVTVPDTSGLVRFDAPTLDNLPAAQTLWMVSGPSAYEPLEPESARSVSRLEHGMRRLQNVEALLQMAVGAAPEDAEEGGRWYRAWAARWVALCNKTGESRLLGRRSEEGVSATAPVPLERLSKEVAARLQSDNTLARVSAKTPPATDLGQLWVQTLERTHPATYCVGRGEPASITLRYRQVEARGFSTRLLGAGALAGLVLLAMVGIRRGDFSTLLRRWPCLLGVLTGLGWWLWLSPSALGWAVVLVSLFASFRWGWRRPRQSGSAIVALTLSQR
jgi:hypothetical protein